MRPRLSVLALIIILLVSGCATPPSDPPATPVAPGHGYALLYDLLGDERNLSKLLIVKRERQELGILVKQVSQTCGHGYQQLEKFAKADGRVDLKDQGLPADEIETRKEIIRTRRKELLTVKGKEFELQLLLNQNEALTYGSHLAATVARDEESSERAAFLRQLASDLGQLRQRMV